MTPLHISPRVGGFHVGALVLLALVVSACDVRITVVQVRNTRASSPSTKETAPCASRD